MPGTLQICVDWAPSNGNDGSGATLIVRTTGTATYEFFCPELSLNDELPDMPNIVTPMLYKICASRFGRASGSLLFDAMRPARSETIVPLTEFIASH